MARRAQAGDSETLWKGYSIVNKKIKADRRDEGMYRCKTCGGEMKHIELASLPPIHRYTCKKCGRVVEERQPTIENKK